MPENNALILSEEDKANLKNILELRCKCGCGFATSLKSKKYRRLYDWLNSKTPLLQNGKYTVTTKLYWVLNGLVDFPLCKFCNKEKMTGNVESLERGYFRACSTSCEGMNASRHMKYVDTCEKKWGSTNFFSSDVGKKIKREWCTQHGVQNPFQLETVKEKSRESRKDRFGCEYTMQSAEKRKLASDKYMRKTGFEHQFKNPTVIVASNSAKDTRKNAGEDIYAKRRITNRKSRYHGFFCNKEVEPAFTEEEFIALDRESQYTVPLRWKCLKCGSKFTALLDQNWSSRKHIPARCMKCHPFDMTVGKSAAETELYDFCRNLMSDDVVENDRTLISPFELDIVMRSHKIAIEFDGLFWHSETSGKKQQYYHLAKTRMCEERGFRLIHVFSDEWDSKKDIVKSRLKNAFGIYDKTIFARKCEIRKIRSGESRKFLDDNHIQGAVNSSVRLGLYFENELVSLMTFGKCRFDKKHEWELVRFCNKLGYHVPGAASKLLKYFERNFKPKSLVSYADRRWSIGNLYSKLGFKFIGNSDPNYWYLRKGYSDRLSRIQFQKHKLAKILPVFDSSKTEVENMKANGYDRIFDCGNMVFEKEYSNEGM